MALTEEMLAAQRGQTAAIAEIEEIAAQLHSAGPAIREATLRALTEELASQAGQLESYCRDLLERLPG